ncbi:efflux transporter outer membrane subunit [Rhizobium leguminosarum]|uniref:efflux transporter outer membrane subunit n=1 Tax=Rhizobium leguminosarum TaxID=384 RepID=UPI002E10DF8D|nr:efflux transporter outer membrane subunit [Rhizobium leguminosarum]
MKTTKFEGEMKLGNRLRLAAALMAATMLAGCVVGPDYRKPEIALPVGWTQGLTTPSADVPALWWKQFRDPVLDSVIETAVSGSPSIASAKARVEEARASYRQEIGADAPHMDGAASARRSRSPGATYASQYQPAVDASWEVDVFGGAVRRREGAAAGLQASEQDLRDAYVSLVGEITTNYVNVRGYQARLALARRTAGSQRTTLGLTTSKMDAGAASMLDVENARALLATTEAGVPDLEAAYLQTVHRLATLSGKAPGELAEMMRYAGRVPAVRALPKAGIPADVVARRPDVRAAERRYAASVAKVGAARADRYPRISLAGSISTSAAKMGDLARSSSIGWSVGPSVTVPLLDAGRLAAAEDVARFQSDEVFQGYRQSVLGALEDVENALVASAQDRAKLSKLSVSADAYAKVVKMTKSSYADGASDFFEVVSAERSLFSAQDALIRAQVAVAVDFVSLNKALGGGWDGETPIRAAAKK